MYSPVRPLRRAASEGDIAKFNKNIVFSMMSYSDRGSESLSVVAVSGGATNLLLAARAKSKRPPGDSSSSLPPFS